MTTTGTKTIPIQRAAIAREHVVITFDDDGRQYFGQAYVVKNHRTRRLDTAITIDQALAQVKPGLAFCRVGWANFARRTIDTTTIVVWFSTMDDYQVFDYLIHQNTEALGDVDVYRSADVLNEYDPTTATVL